MLIPIRTDYRMSRRPWVNYALVAANVLLFLWSYDWQAQMVDFQKIDLLMLQPDFPTLGQFFTSMFLHGGWMHLIGNMVFLWVFGNAINDRFGHLGYAAFYLGGGVIAGLGYVLLSGAAPVLGASGAISAVTGAYLVLFPRVRVTLLVFFYFITYFQISSIYFLLFQFVWNLWMSLSPVLPGARGGGGVAYVAHSAGYVYGIGVAAALLAMRMLPRDVFDLLNLIRNRRRRGKYQRMVAEGWDPFSRYRPAQKPPIKPQAWVESHTVEENRPTAAVNREMELRRRITQAVERHHMEDALEPYLELVQVAEDPVLPRQQQLDVANQLMATGRYPAAADAYERFLRHYPNYPHRPDIHLMLGVLYGRYLHQYDKAEENLARAVEGLHDSQKLALARSDLEAARGKRYR